MSGLSDDVMDFPAKHALALRDLAVAVGAYIEAGRAFGDTIDPLERVVTQARYTAADHNMRAKYAALT